MQINEKCLIYELMFCFFLKEARQQGGMDEPHWMDVCSEVSRWHRSDILVFSELHGTTFPRQKCPAY
ncbi:hypothetical protein MARINON1_51610 [Marinobacter salarius]|nr:hypothetical protein MBHK15_130002 [Marinobacter salarius]VXB91987.1 hypothetical protein MARINON1_51610 [Marinobacter salarius]